MRIEIGAGSAEIGCFEAEDWAKDMEGVGVSPTI